MFVSCIVVLIRSFTRVPVNEASCVRACVHVFVYMHVCILLKLRLHTGSED